MITILINKPEFEYDIHSLVKAFYPEEDVKVYCGEEAGEGMVFRIDFEENGMRMRLGEEAEEEGAWEECAADAGRGERKNVLKQLIYGTLSEHLNKELPWGTLTGIRPTKISMGMIEEGWTEEEILEAMKRTYFISDAKGRLSIEIAKRETEILSSLHYKDGYSLYIGIPFCPTTCLYCSFTSYQIGRAHV